MSEANVGHGSEEEAGGGGGSCVAASCFTSELKTLDVAVDSALTPREATHGRRRPEVREEARAEAMVSLMNLLASLL